MIGEMEGDNQWETTGCEIGNILYSAMQKKNAHEV